MKKPKPLEARVVLVPFSGCWIWLGATNDDGYGRVYGDTVNGRMLAHRWAYELRNGPIPDGVCVLHRCDVPLCVNPDHLYLGTQLQNVRDRVERKRGGGHKITGEAHGRCKITDEIVRGIRNSTETNAALAARLGVGTSQISRIRHYKSWKHIGE